MHKGRRILRYVGNRQTPEIDVWGPGTTHWVQHAASDLVYPMPVTDIWSNQLVPPKPPQHTPLHPALASLFFNRQSSKELQDLAIAHGVVDPPPDEQTAKALSGWRKWKISNSHGEILVSVVKRIGGTMGWPPLEAVEATCVDDLGCASGHDVPTRECSCGIYAAKNPDLLDYQGILGEVYGWGRFVEGEHGYRFQYAYPKCFYVRAESPDTIEFLKTYRVPIYVMQPLQIYSPEEDGYGFGKNEADRHSDAGEDSTAY